MKKKKVLIVEDEAIQALDTKKKLEGLGYEVPEMAASGKDAIQKAAEVRADIVLMDIKLRGKLDGVDTAREIHSRLGIPVIFVTAYAGEEVIQRAKASEPYGYILKPFTRNDLRSNIEVALHKHEIEKNLQETTQFLETILSHTHMLVAYMDAQFNFLRVNAAYARGDEQEPSFFPGKNYFDLFPNEENEAIFKRVVESGEAYFAHAKPFEYVGHPERGVSFWDWSLVPTREHSGTVNGLVLTMADVTERKKAEEALYESEQRYRHIFEESPLGIGISSSDGKVVTGNKTMESITGYSIEELRKINLSDTYVNPEDRETLLEALNQDGKVVDYSVRLKRKDGTPYYALLNTARIDLGGQTFLQTITQDITERVQLEEALRESENLYRVVVEDQTEFITRSNPGLEVTFVNDAFCQYIGRAREELLGENWLESLSKNNQKSTLAHLASLTPENPIAANVHEVIAPDGTRQWEQWTDRAFSMNRAS